MKFYNSVGPNPRVVKMFMAEKGLEVERVEIDLRGGENRQDAYKAKNPHGTTPAMELDNGDMLAEITAICEYIDELHPEPALIGVTPEERAKTRMWVRRIDLNICENLANGFRFSVGMPLFKDRIRTIPQAADDLKASAQEKLAWLNGLMGDHDWVAGQRFTLADILLFCFLDFAGQVGQPMNPDNTWLAAWFERVKARPSAAASA